MKIAATSHHFNRTVKSILFEDLKLSHGQVVFLKKNNGIKVNGISVTVRYTVKEGDIIELCLEDRDEDVNRDIEPIYHPIDVLYEDEDVICVNKPSGMATHPSHNHHGDTLANALAYYFSDKGIPFVFRAVNRLDRETSGVVLVAKNRACAAMLSRYMQQGMFCKEYYAVIKGCPSVESSVIKNYIVRRNDSIIFRTVAEEGKASDYAETHYTVVQSLGDHSIARVNPITGRTHQIRVHFSHMGHPIIGDGLYGDVDLNTKLMLHASSLSFPLPKGGNIKVTSPLPKEFYDFGYNDEA